MLFFLHCSVLGCIQAVRSLWDFAYFLSYTTASDKNRKIYNVCFVWIIAIFLLSKIRYFLSLIFPPSGFDMFVQPQTNRMHELHIYQMGSYNMFGFSLYLHCNHPHRMCLHEECIKCMQLAWFIKNIKKIWMKKKSISYSNWICRFNQWR